MANHETIIPTNKYQTPITRELLEEYPAEIQEWLIDAVANIPFVKNLISPARRYARDMPRDSSGKIIIDLENPHICEDMDYFRPAALFYMKHGCYTLLRPNSNPQSEYKKFWREELRRCREGYVRESDGEWVTGFCYFFLNYTPMMVNIIREGTEVADRTEGFPFFFEGIYWRFHYLYKAKNAGRHAIELAKRGAHPYFEKVYTPDGLRSWGDIQVGDRLFGSKGNIVTVTDIPNNGIMPCYKITLRDGREVWASDDHLWKVRHHSKGEIVVSTKELFTSYYYNRKKSSRTPAGKEYTCAIPKSCGVEYPQRPTKVDPYTFGLLLGDGTFRHDCCYMTQLPKDFEEEKKYIPDEYLYNTKDVRLNLLRGLMDSDGSVNYAGTPVLSTSSARLRDDVMLLARSLGYNAHYTTSKSGYKKDGIKVECLNNYKILIYGGKEVFNLPRKQAKVQGYASNYAKSKKDWTHIVSIEYVGEELCKCVTVDAEDSCYLIGDYVVTHNCAKSYSLASIMVHNLIMGESEKSIKRITTVLTAYEKEYLKDDKDGTLNKFTPTLDFVRTNTEFARLLLKNNPNDMTWQSGYKDSQGITKGSRNQVLGVSAKDNPDKLRGKRGWILFEEMGAFKGLLPLYDTTRRSVEDGNYAFACMYLLGTANEKESSFESAKILLYKTDGYRILTLRNMYDKANMGKPTFGFFFPAYVNRAGCYNKDGVSDVIKALLEIFNARYKAKYGTDPTSVLRVIAEDPITPAEAIVKVKDAYFPVQDLNERLIQIESSPRFFDDVLVGNMVLKDGKAEFVPTYDTPIRKFGVDNDTVGAVEIFALPEKDSNGNIPSFRYIIGHDPVDNDKADSSSLSSTIVFDLFKDEIVAEFTGRHPMAEDNYEVVRRLCMFYNAQCLYESNRKGLYTYFKQKSSVYMLADTPKYLRDKGLVKYEAFGSNTKGVNANAAINSYANNLIRNWLIDTRTVMVKNEKGETEESSMPNLYFIKNKALLEELVAFAPEINVDRIRALGMAMLGREEIRVLYQGDMSKVNDTDDRNDPGNDEFFSENFDGRFEEAPFSNFSMFSDFD